MYKFGTIVLVPFPYTDLSASKVRPALIVSTYNKKSEDVIVCFISSKETISRGISLESNEETGLKVKSIVRTDKIATLSKKIILGELGIADTKYLKKHSKEFHEVFGF